MAARPPLSPHNMSLLLSSMLCSSLFYRCVANRCTLGHISLCPSYSFLSCPPSSSFPPLSPALLSSPLFSSLPLSPSFSLPFLSSLLSVPQPPPQTDVHHSALLQYHATHPQQPNQPVPLIPTQKPVTQSLLPPQQLVHGGTAATPTQLLPGSGGTGVGTPLPPSNLLALPHQQQLYSTTQQVGRGEGIKG